MNKKVLTILLSILSIFVIGTVVISIVNNLNINQNYYNKEEILEKIIESENRLTNKQNETNDQLNSYSEEIEKLKEKDKELNDSISNLPKYTITFITNSDTVIPSQEVVKGEKIIKPLDPKKEGHEFLGWYIDEEKWIFNGYVVTENITLEAKWKSGFTITYVLNGGTNNIDNPSFYYITESIVLKEPTKEGFYFDGWYKDKTFTEKIEKIEKGSMGDITLYAKFIMNPYPITFVYEYNNETIETTYNISYGYSLKDYGPKVLNEYNDEVENCWVLDPDSELTNKTLSVVGPMKVYSIGVYTKFNNKYNAIRSHDKSKLLVDFTNAEEDLDFCYQSEKGVSNITFIGNSEKTYHNFSISLFNSTEDITITLINFKYCAQENTIGLDASKLSENTVLHIKANGNCQIIGGNGSNGSNGTSYNRNKSTKKPNSGQPGTAGYTGASAILANNIFINIDINGSLTLIGGNGGNGGTGGNGEGSASDGIAQCGHGAVGGNGGKGANALVINRQFKFNSVGSLIVIGGNGGNGGNGGSGGNNQDTGAFDRADHGGNGADGGNGGSGGLGIYIASQVKTEIKDGITIYSTGGNGGIGGNGGDGGNSCKNEFQSSSGGNPGNAGSGGYGGAGGDASNVNTLPLNGTGGKGNHGGYSGVPGTAHNGKVGTSGVNRLEEWASDGE